MNSIDEKLNIIISFNFVFSMIYREDAITINVLSQDCCNSVGSRAMGFET